MPEAGQGLGLVGRGAYQKQGPVLFTTVSGAACCREACQKQGLGLLTTGAHVRHRVYGCSRHGRMGLRLLTSGARARGKVWGVYSRGLCQKQGPGSLTA